MATFSPSPAPRRTNRRPQGDSPPVASRRTKFAASKSTSRLATPLRPDRLSVTSQLQGDHASPTSGMDVDDRSLAVSERAQKSEAVFAVSEEMVVSFHAHLPVEVKQVLQTADFYNDLFTGEIDTGTGFSLVASERTCFVWQHAHAITTTPTCYIFSCPRDVKQSGPPLHALVPYGPSREPGLILVSPSGEVRFWYGIGIGLAGGDNYSTTALDLDAGEYVTNLIRSDPQTYVASTSGGHFVRMTLTSTGGKYRLNAHGFSRPQSSLSLSRLLPSLWLSGSASTRPEGGNVNALACGAETTIGREIWALVDTRLQKWSMSVEGWEEILLDEELLDIIRDAIRAAFPSTSSDNGVLDLELLDLIIARPGALVILASYAGTQDETTSDSGNVHRIYTLVWLSCRDSPTVDSVSMVPYQSTSTYGAPMHPRMQSATNGALICIQFGDAVALCSRYSDYRDRLELKSATDRTLGVGVLHQESTLLILTSATMMKVQMDVGKISNFDPDTGQTNLIKTIMTQAILYGANAENPLQFSFPPDVDEEALMQAAEQLSRAIVESDTTVVRVNHDLGAQLTERKERLSWLIQFINDNAVLNRMSQRSRQRLATDAETLYACHQLWLLHNDTLATGHSHSVLSEAVHTYMHSIGEAYHEDVMRAFFRLRAPDIGQLLPYAMAIVERSKHERGRSLSNALPEGNMIILTILKSAFGYGGYNLGVYGIELPMIDPWTSRPAVIDIVLNLFEMTTKFVDSPTSRTDPTGSNKKEADEQLPELASVLFACIQERLAWLGSSLAADTPGTSRDRTDLEARFAQLRPDILETLFQRGHETPAFALAEQYRDFSSLASLCHKETVYPPEQNPHAERIRQYIDRYRSEFATALFRWYIDHGELRLLFAHGDMYDANMDVFFAENHFPSVSWLHELGKGRYGPASHVLLSESGKATNLETKHVMLSIGKLAHLAQLHESEATGDESVLDAFHDDLDFVSVQQNLSARFQSVLSSIRSRLSLDGKVDAIAKAEAILLSDRKAHLTIFKQCVRHLLQGRALSAEDVVDILTLKDNLNNTDDYATALHILARVRNMPEARRMSACQAVWRRIYLHDDWNKIRHTANVTDAELNDRFQRTALYASLKSILPKRSQRVGCDLSPPQALGVPTATEIAARWPTMDAEGVGAILQCYQSESERVGKLGLEHVYDRVKELVEQDVMWG